METSAGGLGCRGSKGPRLLPLSRLGPAPIQQECGPSYADRSPRCPCRWWWTATGRGPKAEVTFFSLFSIQEKPRSPRRARKASGPQNKAARSLLPTPRPPLAPLPSPQLLCLPRGMGGREGTHWGSQLPSPRGCRLARRSSASSSQSSASPRSACASAASLSTTRASTAWPSSTPTARPTR